MFQITSMEISSFINGQDHVSTFIIAKPKVKVNNFY